MELDTSLQSLDYDSECVQCTAICKRISLVLGLKNVKAHSLIVMIRTSLIPIQLRPNCEEVSGVRDLEGSN